MLALLQLQNCARQIHDYEKWPIYFPAFQIGKKLHNLINVFIYLLSSARNTDAASGKTKRRTECNNIMIDYLATIYLFFIYLF